MNSKFDVMVEGQEVLIERFDKADARFKNFEHVTKSNFQTVFQQLSNVDDDIKELKSDVKEVKIDLKEFKKETKGNF